MVSAVNCASLLIHRPLSLKQIVHYMSVKKKKKTSNKPGVAVIFSD